jgi:hypothetical protein
MRSYDERCPDAYDHYLHDRCPGEIASKCQTRDTTKKRARHDSLWCFFRYAGTSVAAPRVIEDKRKIGSAFSEAPISEETPATDNKMGPATQ